MSGVLYPAAVLPGSHTSQLSTRADTQQYRTSCEEKTKGPQLRAAFTVIANVTTPRRHLAIWKLWFRLQHKLCHVTVRERFSGKLRMTLLHGEQEPFVCGDTCASTIHYTSLKEGSRHPQALIPCLMRCIEYLEGGSSSCDPLRSSRTLKEMQRSTVTGLDRLRFRP